MRAGAVFPGPKLPPLLAPRASCLSGPAPPVIRETNRGSEGEPIHQVMSSHASRGPYSGIGCSIVSGQNYISFIFTSHIVKENSLHPVFNFYYFQDFD